MSVTKMSNTLREELLRNIPLEWRQNFGGDFYEQYLKLRLRLLKAQVETTGGEHPIEYTKIERGSPHKMIFLPGFADTKENFYNAAQLLASDCDLIIPDLPGFGGSFRDKDEVYHLENFAKWMQEFVEHIGWKKFHLVGNSLGAAVAVKLSLVIPEKIQSLTLADCAAVVLPDQPSIYQEFVEGRNIFHISTLLQFDYFLQRVFFKPPLIPPFVKEHLYRDFVKHSRWHRKILHDLLEGVTSLNDPSIDKFTLNKSLSQITVPTMVVWGDEDSFFHVSTAAYIHAQIPKSKLYIMADCGHGPQVEAPQQFARLLKKFLRSLNHS